MCSSCVPTELNEPFVLTMCLLHLLPFLKANIHLLTMTLASYLILDPQVRTFENVVLCKDMCHVGFQGSWDNMTQ